MSKIDYLKEILKIKASVVTRAIFWRIPHNEEAKVDIRLKLGRYTRGHWGKEAPEEESPKSELTLDQEEFDNLVKFLQENYEPFKEGFKRYLPLADLKRADLDNLRAFFDREDNQELVDFVVKNNILSTDLLRALEYKKRISVVEEFQEKLDTDNSEYDWQKWFQTNSWVLGSDFVHVIDDRRIDPQHTADFLVRAYDGFVDVIEIKKPNARIQFWSSTKDHDNWIPSVDLVKAVTQSARYVYELEKKTDSQDFLERTGGSKVVKPRCILIFGRSNNWDSEQKEAYRLLNASYHNILILTYDHVLERAKRILGLEGDELKKKIAVDVPSDDIPF